MKSFKEKNKELQFLIRDMLSLRSFNDSQAKNDTPDKALLFAEAAVLCVAFERFLRIIPAIKAKDGDTLSNLLDKAFAKKNPVFKPIHSANVESFKKALRDIRNGILHGLYDDLAKPYKKDGKISSTEEYFKNFFTQDMELIFLAFKQLINQIDPETGIIR